MFSTRLLLPILTLGLIGAAGEAAAQQRTSATYDDWVVQCETKAGPPPVKTCEMQQVTQMQNKGTPFSRLVIAKPVKGQPIKLVVQVPVNVSMQASVKLQSADNDPGATIAFDRCVPGGCFAEFEIKDDVMKKLRAATALGKVIYKDSAGQDIAIPVSFKGFAPAIDALAKE